MALRLGISLTAYRDLEKGATSIMNGNLTRIATLLDTSAEEIILGYRPAQVQGHTSDNTLKEYRKTIENLEKRIEDLEKTIRTQDVVIRSKDEIISMLKRSLAEVK
jgi:transcriptional regulator with XRE-family HTH domain